MTEQPTPASAPPDLIEDAANILIWRGHLEPGGDGFVPDEIVAQLVALWAEGPCGECPGWGNPDVLAEHLVTRWQCDHERSLPVRTCECGTGFKTLMPFGNQREDFYLAGDDGLLGDHAGWVGRDRKGRVTHSGKCPCGRSLAEIAGEPARAVQDALFDVGEAP